MATITDAPIAFDPEKFRQATRAQWEAAAEAWDRWAPLLARWLGPATEAMLDMAAVGPGARVLDVAAGAGDQTLAAARRVGAEGYVLATDISPAILRFALRAARQAGLAHVETLELDGERHDTLPEASFDAAISRVGLIYLPASAGHSSAAGALPRLSIRPPRRIHSSPNRWASFAGERNYRRRCLDSRGHFRSGARGFWPRHWSRRGSARSKCASSIRP
jgi:SAM-dependent methyltransferase